MRDRIEIDRLRRHYEHADDMNTCSELQWATEAILDAPILYLDSEGVATGYKTSDGITGKYLALAPNLRSVLTPPDYCGSYRLVKTDD